MKEKLNAVTVAERYISNDTQTAPKEQHPEGKKAPATVVNEIGNVTIVMPVKEETKSRRLQLLIKPSLYETLKHTADIHNCSVNEMVSIILSNVLERK